MHAHLHILCDKRGAFRPVKGSSRFTLAGHKVSWHFSRMKIDKKGEKDYTTLWTVKEESKLLPLLKVQADFEKKRNSESIVLYAYKNVQWKDLFQAARIATRAGFSRIFLPYLGEFRLGTEKVPGNRLLGLVDFPVTWEKERKADGEKKKATKLVFLFVTQGCWVIHSGRIVHEPGRDSLSVKKIIDGASEKSQGTVEVNIYGDPEGPFAYFNTMFSSAILYDCAARYNLVMVPMEKRELLRPGEKRRKR